MRVVDLFAGWGGFSLGAEMAGMDVLWAANHWPLAVEAHAANHPGTDHVCQDLRQADWTSLPDFDVLVASPACQGHSSASQPKRRAYHDAQRATAWAVVDCAEVTRPAAVVVENVPAFGRWQLFPLWCDALRLLGYQVQTVELTASDFGVPQRRRRLFVVCTRSGADLRFQPTTEPAFGPCVDWEAGAWRAIAEAGPAARKRITEAAERHGERFLVQHVTGHRGLALSEPIRTITCQDQWAVVDGDTYRPLTIRENARAMGFPDDYGWPAGATRRDVVRGIG